MFWAVVEGCRFGINVTLFGLALLGDLLYVIYRVIRWLALALWNLVHWGLERWGIRDRWRNGAPRLDERPSLRVLQGGRR